MTAKSIVFRRTTRRILSLSVLCALIGYFSISEVRNFFLNGSFADSNPDMEDFGKNEVVSPSVIDSFALSHPQLVGDPKKALVSYVREKELKELEISASKIESISQVELYESLIRRGAEVDSDMATRMKNNSMTAADWDLIDIYAASLLSAEDNFKIELWQYKNFDQLKLAFEKRAAETGNFYGTELLNQPNAYKGASLDDIKSLIDAGASLPEDFLNKAVYANNIDLAVKLKSAGINFNSDFIDHNTSRNAIEVQVESYATNPFGSSAEEQINNVKKLIDLGVSLKVSDGTRDPLDYALQGAFNHDGAEAESLMLLAKNIHALGIELEDSSQELLDNIRVKNPTLYEKYIGSFSTK